MELLLLGSLGALLIRLGFAIHAAGMTRSKNSAATVIRHLADLCVATLAFWAVGYAVPYSGGPRQPLVEHWNGVTWSVVSVPSPAPSDSQLYGITAVGAVIAAAIDEAIGVPGGVMQLPATPQRVKALLRAAQTPENA